MSEFKYACPVCGQHIRCDSTQSGSVMECPTCLQKIIAPQAPAGSDQKFIISGKKWGGGPRTRSFSMAAASLPPARRGFPLAAVALIMLIAATAAAAFVFRAQIFKIRGDQGSTLHGGANSSSTSGSAGVDASVVPPMVIPPANDTNWTLNLDAAVFPDTPAAGRIHGHDFLGERACLQGGALTVRWGGRGAADFAFTIDFGGAQATALSGKTINITPKTPIAAKVTLRWQETGQVVKDDFDTGYALRLEFGELAGDHLPGKIYFCAPDDSKSYLAGTFNAEIRTPRSVKLNE